jgi:WD40 repeat protein
LIIQVRWSPDGSKILATGLKTLPIWNASNGERLITLFEESYDENSDVVWNNNGSQFASLIGTKLQIWDANTFTEVKQLIVPPTSDVLAWGGTDNNQIAVGVEKDAQIWNIETSQLIKTLSAHGGSIYSMGWKGSDLFTTSEDSTIRIWSVPSGQTVRILTGHTAAVISASWNTDGTKIVTGSSDNSIRLWDIGNGTLLQVYEEFHGSFDRLTWRPQHNQIATTDGYYFKTWNTDNGSLIHTYKAPIPNVKALEWSPTGSKIASSGDNGRVYIWDAVTHQLQLTLTATENDPNVRYPYVRLMAWKTDGTQLVTVVDSTIKVWNTTTGQLLLTFQGHLPSSSSSPPYITGLDWSPDGTKIVTTGHDRTLRIWNSITGLLITLVSLSNDPQNVVWNREGTQLAVGDNTGIQIYKLETDGTIQSLTRLNDPNTKPVDLLSWYGVYLLATGRTDEIVRVWNTVSGELITNTSSTYGGSIRAVKWNSDGSHFAVGDYDQLCIYGLVRPDTPAIYRPTTITFHFPTLPSVTFGNPNDHPITGDWDGDGVDTLGVFDPLQGRFQLRNSNTPGAPDLSFLYGNPGDTPLAGHWTATALHDGVGTYRNTNGTMYLFLRNQLTTGYADLTAIVGNPGDLPIVGDWNGDGVDTVGLYRPDSTTFYLFNRNAPDMQPEVIFTLSGGVPIAGRWTGSGGAGVGFFADGVFSLKDTLESGAFDRTVNFGETGDLPLAGRWSP